MPLYIINPDGQITGHVEETGPGPYAPVRHVEYDKPLETSESQRREVVSQVLSVEEAEDVLYDKSCVIARQEVSKHRWYTRELIVFERDGIRLGFYYLNPASELQEDQERFESDPVEVFPVAAREVTTTVYDIEKERV